MKKILLTLVLLIAALQTYEHLTRNDRATDTSSSTTYEQPRASSASIVDAFRARRSNIQVQASGKVVRVLPDDRDGSRHQRIIVTVAPAHTVLIAHNIDLAPRLEGLRPGDRIEFNGEYEWNERGGVVHWTHRDPQGRHEAGWIRYDGRLYQ